MTKWFMYAAGKGIIRGLRPFKNQRQYNACARKIRHDNLWSAMLHIRGLERRKKRSLDMNVYPCKYCQGLHVGRNNGYNVELAEGEFEFARP